MNVSTEIIPDHKIYFGQARITEDNSPSLALFDTIENKYNLNKFGSADDIDLKISKNSGFLDYSAGVYNLNKKNAVSGGYTTFKPLHALPQTGNLEIGGGYFTNQTTAKNKTAQENTYSVFTGYKFKRFSTKSEFLRKDYAYNDGQYSDSLHFSNKFAFTKNLNLTAGYQLFKETKSTVNDVGLEYSIDSANIKNFKLELNASFIQYQEKDSQNSQRLGIKTKYSF